MSAGIEIQIRRLILALLTFGLAATTVDLLALGHYKDSWQLIPLVSMIAALVAIVWHVFSGFSATSLRVLRIVMAGIFLVGVIGTILHFRGSRTFQLDANPDLSGLPLILKVLHAKSPPTLAPGAMVQMGILGLIYGFRHPSLRK
jgi:hypothetical protein